MLCTELIEEAREALDSFPVLSMFDRVVLCALLRIAEWSCSALINFEPSSRQFIANSRFLRLVGVRDKVNRTSNLQMSVQQKYERCNTQQNTECDTDGDCDRVRAEFAPKATLWLVHRRRIGREEI